ncbi:hypothetical protein CR513_03854, partial [Mucuna pruriens]
MPLGLAPDWAPCMGRVLAWLRHSRPGPPVVGHELVGPAVKEQALASRIHVNFLDLNPHQEYIILEPWGMPSVPIEEKVRRGQTSSGKGGYEQAIIYIFHKRSTILDLMHLEDKEKTTFITDNGNFCYKVMSFGLKNIGATYQQLMDNIFRDQIGYVGQSSVSCP